MSSEGQPFEESLKDSSSAVAAFDAGHRSVLKSFQHFLHGNPSAVPLIVLILLIGFFAAAIGPKFFSAYTLTLILQQIAVVGILGIAQTLVILTAGIDLSIGAIMVISAVFMGNCALTYGLPTPLAILAGGACGGLLGAINGALIAYAKLPPFIVTLGTWNVIMALTFIYSGNETLRDADISEKAPLLQFFASNFKLGSAVFTLGVVTMVLLFFFVWYVLNHTAWGRHVYAVGDEPDAAELSGVRTKRLLFQVYTVAGLIAGLAAWVSIGRTGSISPSSILTDFNLQSITAAVIGGISLFGGRGSLLGTLFGTLIVGVMSMGLNMMGADPQWKILLTGLFIIGAVVVDQWIRKVSG